MGYELKFYVDGGCRGEGTPWVNAAAACCLMRKDGSYTYRSASLPWYPTPTARRAEFTAIIMALEFALERWTFFGMPHEPSVRIHSDCRSAIKRIRWAVRRRRKGRCIPSWYRLRDRDLATRVCDLIDMLKKLGSVGFTWVPRTDNEIADSRCILEMNRQARYWSMMFRFWVMSWCCPQIPSPAYPSWQMSPVG